MSNSKWISLHDASLKITDVPIPSDYQQKLHLRPEIDPSDIRLIQFAKAGQQGKIKARGNITKASFFDSEGIFNIETDKLRIYDGMLKCEWNQDKRDRLKGKKQFPFVNKLAQDKDVVEIGSSFWEDLGQIWKNSQLISFNFDINSELTKKLVLKHTFTENKHLNIMRQQRECNFDVSGNPVFVYCDNVEVEMASLKNWLRLNKKPKSIKKKGGRRYSIDWDYYELYFDDYILKLEADLMTNKKPYLFLTVSEFVTTYIDYIDRRLYSRDTATSLQNRAFVNRIRGAKSTPPHPSARKIQKYIREEVSRFELAKIAG